MNDEELWEKLTTMIGRHNLMENYSGDLADKIMPLIKSNRIEWLKGLLGEGWVCVCEEEQYLKKGCYCGASIRNQYRSQILENAKKEDK